MVIGLLLIFIVIIYFLQNKRFFRIAKVLMVIWGILFVLIGYGVIPHFLSKKIQSSYSAKMLTSWGDSNIIILLGGGVVNALYDDGGHFVYQKEVGFAVHSRINKAMILYRQCKQKGKVCKVLVSGGDAAGVGLSEAELYATSLQDVGVSKEDIIEENKSLNTWENAKFSVPLLKKYHADQLVLVSSGVHLKRSLLYFSHFNVHPIGIRADFLAERRSFLPLAFNFVVTDYIFHEYVGILKYYIYCAIGLND